MTDWNPTDDNLRDLLKGHAIGADRYPGGSSWVTYNLARLVLREREAKADAHERRITSCNAASDRADSERARAEKAERRLLQISLMWAQRTNQGRAFVGCAEDVPRMRELLDGYVHPDELGWADDGED